LNVSGQEGVVVGREVLNTLDVAAGLKITSITDAKGAEYRDKRTVADLKRIARAKDQLVVRYQVTGVMKVSLWVEYEPSAIHEDFYAAFAKSPGVFEPPRIATLLTDQTVSPGVHEVKWDGRDMTDDKRLCLAGAYKVKLVGHAPNKPSDETTIEIAPPHAHNFGIHYKKKGSWESCKKECKSVQASQGALKDGTKYDAEVHLSKTAMQAADLWQESAVVYMSGHSYPDTFWLHSQEGKGYSKKADSYLTVYGSGEDAPEPPNVSVQSLEDGALADMMMIMFNSCRSGNEIVMVQNRLRRCFPGKLDGKHGKKTTAGLTHYQRIVGIEPADGTKNAATLAWYKLDASKSDYELTRAIQQKLRSYYVRSDDGIYGDDTREAVRNFQRDYPNLNATGDLDADTLRALKVGFGRPRNLAEAMLARGGDLAIGFIHKIDFDLATDWGINFWKNLAKGEGVMDAASAARASVDVRRRKQCDFGLYAQDGVSKNTTVHPARYGRYREGV
jgi:peptidoglycan hydrolase-like protein with peptidoglycan-binding domain